MTRDFVRQCQAPVLILPEDVPAHPYAVAMEAATLPPNAEVRIYPWKGPPGRIPLAVIARSSARIGRRQRRRRDFQYVILAQFRLCE